MHHSLRRTTWLLRTRKSDVGCSIDARRAHDALHVIGIAPEQEPIGTGRPHLPRYVPFLRILEQVRKPVAGVVLILHIDVRGVKRQPHLLHPQLGIHRDAGPLSDRVVVDPLVYAFRPQIGWFADLSDNAEDLVQKVGISSVGMPASPCMRKWILSISGKTSKSLARAALV